MISRSGNQIREDFLRFFEVRGHRRVHSSSLVPANDPTLLFTNAGMNQFKDVFLGAEKRAYTRAVSSQKCVRAGGKHNDLENVGFTRRHHTFFEMLGNFSFGDYFKKDAVAYAWELLTSPEWFGIDPAKLYVTIFEGDARVPRDDEAEAFWIGVGVPKERIFGMSAKDNFWQMGDTGPCGPCSEIYYDLGLEAADEAGTDKPFPLDEQRYVEIWNLVFMQFDRSSDGTLTPLPKPSIDTGMGLERVAAVLQGVLSNFETDLFVPLIQRAAELTGIAGKAAANVECVTGPNDPVPPPMTKEEKQATTKIADITDKDTASLRIIADHARAATFLIADGVQPANEGRGYVLRKILRRGIRHGRLLGQEKPFMHEMVFAVRDEMSVAYPELNDALERVSKVVFAEELQFARVMATGSKELNSAFLHAMSFAITALHESKPQLLRQAFEQQHSSLDPLAPRFDDVWNHYLDGSTSNVVQQLYGPIAAHLPQHYHAQLAGHEAFFLYETYGLPADFIKDATRDGGIRFDDEGFDKARLQEQHRARASWKGGSQKSASPYYRRLSEGLNPYVVIGGVQPSMAFPSEVDLSFVGYEALRVETQIIAIMSVQSLTDAPMSQAMAGQACRIVLQETPFYARSGGQIGDHGRLLALTNNVLLADVTDSFSPVAGVRVIEVMPRTNLHVGDAVLAIVDPDLRHAIARNHTATHLLHAALREVLGLHVKQAGSLVDQSHLRFDFEHPNSVADEELAEVESIVNRQVLANAKVETLVDVPIDVAVNELGAMALFGEKYGDRVRVVQIGGTGGFSTELCGGTHTGATGEIGLIKIVGENSVSSGVRRVEAISGTGALQAFRHDFDVARAVGQLTGSSDADSLRAKLSSQDEEMKKLRRELDQVRMKAASASVADSAGNAVEVKGVKVLAQRVDGLDKGQMRELIDGLRQKLGSGVVVLGAAAEGKVALIVGVTKDLTSRVQAGKIVGALAAKVGGKGGGRPDLAEAGGNDAGALDGALAGAIEVVGSLLG